MTGVLLGGLYIPHPPEREAGEHPVERQRREFMERLRALKPGEPLLYGSKTHYYGGPMCTHDDRVWVIDGKSYAPADAQRAADAHDPRKATAPEFLRCVGCGAWRVWGRAAEYYAPGWRPKSEQELGGHPGVGDTVRWVDAPDGALVLSRPPTSLRWWYRRIGDLGVVAGIGGSEPGARADFWADSDNPHPWTSLAAADRMVEIVALGLTGTETVAELRAIAGVSP